MAWTYEIATDVSIANATVEKGLRDGEHKIYRISANEGYVLHDKSLGWSNIDPDTGEETWVNGYTGGTVSCGATYDFTTNPREFYAVPTDSVPADQIFGGGAGRGGDGMTWEQGVMNSG